MCKNWDGVRGKKTTEMGGVRDRNRQREIGHTNTPAVRI